MGAWQNMTSVRKLTAHGLAPWGYRLLRYSSFSLIDPQVRSTFVEVAHKPLNPRGRPVGGEVECPSNNGVCFVLPFRIPLFS